jgi:hypothetical protein
VSGAEHDQDDVEVEGELRITNEFTSVRVRKVHTRNGEQIEISSLRVPHRIRLDALLLESLCWRSHEDLSKGLETPFGSAADPTGEAPE